MKAPTQDSLDRLKFRPRARIIRTIGDQLISGPEAAVIELVKNAYDADATRVVVRFVPPLIPGQGRITVQDDGHGMTLSDIQDRWMEPATASKLGNRRSPGRQRLMMGSKGIGRFAAAKLGGRLFVRSVSERSGARVEIMVGEIDWSVFDGDTYLDDVSIGLLTQPTEEATGTEIEVRALAETWSREKLERLLLELRRLISPLGTRDDVFRIILDLSACTEATAGFDGATLVEGTTGSLPGEDRQDVEPFEVRPFPLLTACDYEVVGTFDAEGTFTGSMEIRRAGQAPTPITFAVPLQPDEDSCGPVEVRFFLFDREAEAVKANVARAGLGSLTASAARSIIDNVTGVAVYRDGFRIRPYGDPENDWLTLDTRRVNRPTLRIGHNQIAGYLAVDGQDGDLQEKSSREGFEENGAYRRLQRLVLTLLSREVEPRRQIFREKAGLSRSPSGGTFDEVRALSELKRLRKFAASLPEAERIEAVGIIDKEAANLAARIADLEERHRILEARSSLGAIIAEVLHEGEPEVGYIVTTARRLQRLWPNVIHTGERQAEAQEEFPGKLAWVRDSGEKLSALFDALRPLSGGRRTTPPQAFFPTDPIARAKALFAGSPVNIEQHNGPQAPKVLGYPDDLATAMINLLKNAVHWLEESRTPDPRVDIRYTAAAGKLRIDVEDNGPGIPAEFIERVFDPGFTLREGGTGLGLNIAREALARSHAVLGHDPEFSPGTRFTIIMDRDRPNR